MLWRTMYKSTTVYKRLGDEVTTRACKTGEEYVNALLASTSDAEDERIISAFHERFKEVDNLRDALVNEYAGRDLNALECKAFCFLFSKMITSRAVYSITAEFHAFIKEET